MRDPARGEIVEPRNEKLPSLDLSFTPTRGDTETYQNTDCSLRMTAAYGIGHAEVTGAPSHSGNCRFSTHSR